jgi:HEAT repeat protein
VLHSSELLQNSISSRGRVTAAARASFPDGSDDSHRFSERDSPLAFFARAHGVDAIDLYLEVLRRYRHVDRHDEKGNLFAYAAVRGMVIAPARADEAAILREIAADEEASPSVRTSVLDALAHITGEKVAILLDARLLQEEDKTQRGFIVSRLLELKDPSTAAELLRASEKEPDKELRAEMAWVGTVVSERGRCLLYGSDRVMTEWVCNYRCAGKHSIRNVLSSVECARTIQNISNQ